MLANGLWSCGVRLFEKHANIIVADPDAAAGVFQFAEKTVAAVQDKFGFELVCEIKLLGGF